MIRFISKFYWVGFLAGTTRHYKNLILSFRLQTLNDDDDTGKLHQTKHLAKGEMKNKERGPKSKPEEQSPKWVQRGIGTNYVPVPPLKYYWLLCWMGTFASFKKCKWEVGSFDSEDINGGGINGVLVWYGFWTYHPKLSSNCHCARLRSCAGQGLGAWFFACLVILSFRMVFDIFSLALRIRLGPLHPMAHGVSQCICD
jgi:hypothetical protein